MELEQKIMKIRCIIYIDNFNDINNKINFRNNKKYSFTNANSRTNINIKRNYFDHNLSNNNSEKIFYPNKTSYSCNLNIDNDEDINFKLISKINNNIDNIVEEKNEKDFNSDIKLPEPNKNKNNENKDGEEKEKEKDDIKEEHNNNNDNNDNDDGYIMNRNIPVDEIEESEEISYEEIVSDKEKDNKN